MVLGQNQSFNDFPTGGVPIVSHFASPLVGLIGSMIINFQCEKTKKIWTRCYVDVSIEKKMSKSSISNCQKRLPLSKSSLLLLFSPIPLPKLIFGILSKLFHAPFNRTVYPFVINILRFLPHFQSLMVFSKVIYVSAM